MRVQRLPTLLLVLCFSLVWAQQNVTDPNSLSYGYIYNFASSSDYIATGVFAQSTQQAFLINSVPPTVLLQFGGFTAQKFVLQQNFSVGSGSLSFSNNAVVDEATHKMYFPTTQRTIVSVDYTQPQNQVELGLPQNFDTPTATLLQDNWILVSGYRVPTCRIMRFPSSNFTEQSIKDPLNGPIIFAPGGSGCSFPAATSDSNWAYFGDYDSQNASVYRVNFKVADFQNSGLDSQTLKLSIGKLVGAFSDPVRKLIYFFNANSLVVVSTVNFTQIGYLQFDQYATDATGVVHDQDGGHAYFSHYTSPGMISHVNLKTFSLVETFRLPDGQQSLYGAVLDIKTNRAYFWGYGTVVQVNLPYACLNNCSYASGKGVSCSYATCTCADGWTGEDCSAKRCPDDCNLNGDCNDGTCACYPAWTGDTCATQQCPNECLGRGTCNADFTCSCHDDWSGDDCSVSPPVPPCEKLTSCTACYHNTSCGWCESSNKCMYGDAFGPLNEGVCTYWAYADCPSLFYSAIGWLMSAFAFLLLAISILLTFFQDINIPLNTKTRQFVVRFWWRNQLSAKAWHLIDRIQLAAITSYFAVSAPASYAGFTQAFRWSILAFPVPWSKPDIVRPTRDLLSFDDHARVMDAYNDEIFLGDIFWLAVVLVGVLVLFVILNLVAFCVDSKNFKTMARTRIVYSTIRILMFGYYGVACTALYTLMFYQDSASFRRADATNGLGVAAAMLAVIVVGLPLFTFGILFNKKKELFILHFSMKFGCLFQSFHFKKSYFSTLQLGKKLLVAIWVGLLYKSSVAQLILIAATHLGYFIAVLVVKPYIDHIHFFIDLVVTALDFIMVLLLLGFSSTNNTTVLGCAIAAIVLHIIAMLIIVVGFFNSILKMHQINSFGQLFRVISGQENLSDSEAMTSK